MTEQQLKRKSSRPRVAISQRLKSDLMIIAGQGMSTEEESLELAIHLLFNALPEAKGERVQLRPHVENMIARNAAFDEATTKLSTIKKIIAEADSSTPSSDVINALKAVFDDA